MVGWSRDEQDRSLPDEFDRGQLGVAAVGCQAVPEAPPIVIAVDDPGEVPIPGNVPANVGPQFFQGEAVAVLDLLPRDPGGVGEVGVWLAHGSSSSDLILPRR